MGGLRPDMVSIAFSEPCIADLFYFTKIIMKVSDVSYKVGGLHNETADPPALQLLLS